eukprot:GDKH01024878.1.p2 GENE.GDKH01024878.1~~GDKH01024878.1.p2  ORF type:complete len:59 (+),score=4.64 GDKH01024878.1:176-352(+)
MRVAMDATQVAMHKRVAMDVRGRTNSVASKHQPDASNRLTRQRPAALVPLPPRDCSRY